MARPQASQPAKLVVGALSAHSDAWAAARERLLERWGPVDLETGPLGFDLTDYYADEMGAPLSRWFVAFGPLVGQHQLAAIKHETNGLEEEIAGSGRWPAARPVNLDPGYVTLGKLVLATAKDQAHRLAVGEDIYAEVTLRFAGRRFVANEWTYPDYRQDSYLDFFGRVRARLKEQLRGG